MYKKVSKKWMEKIYENVQSVINIYIDNVLINPKYVLALKKGGNVFEEELTLGSVPSQYIEIKIHKRAGIQNPKKIKIEYGILINNALTVEEINEMLLGNVEETLFQSITEKDNNFEMIPIRNL